MYSRTLFSIPILHTQNDMGELIHKVSAASLQEFGGSGYARKMELIDQAWSQIESIVTRLNIPAHTIRLYQDGLPVCGKEHEIVQDLARSDSRNHRLLLSLVEKGAVLMGTESPELLVEEYELFKHLLSSERSSDTSMNTTDAKALSESLLKQRDRFIADRINRTLKPGETGILFLGMLHGIENYLDQDIRVINPINYQCLEGGEKNES